MFEEYPDIVTVQQLRQMLNIGYNTAYNLIHSEQIKTFRIGNKIKVPKKSVVQYVESQIH